MKALFRSICGACHQDRPCCATVYLLAADKTVDRIITLCRDCRFRNAGSFRVAERHLSEHDRKSPLEKTS